MYFTPIYRAARYHQVSISYVFSVGEKRLKDVC